MNPYREDEMWHCGVCTQEYVWLWEAAECCDPDKEIEEAEK
jgi:hypothetical protein